MHYKISIFSKRIIESFLKSIYLIILSGVLVVIFSSQNFAIPSFARQTNLSCNYCHYAFPTLNSFGRLFKLNGYTMTNIETIDAVSPDSERTTLKLLSTYSFSSMVKASYTSISKAVPGTENNFAQVPEEVSLFLSGEITPNMGTFVQATYGLADGTIGLDQLDVRYADHAKIGSNELIYGLSLNNIPTTQDVWNSTPVWGFPYTSSEPAPAPSASTMLDAPLEGVAGLGAYMLYNRLIYAEISLYHSSPAGVSYPPDASWENNIKGISPYWRLAIQHQWKDQYIEVGTYGMSASFYPTGITGLTNKNTDYGFDGQYEKNIENGSSLIFHAAYTTEKQNLDATFNSEAAANNKNTLNSFKTDLTYNFPEYVSLTAGYFLTSGSTDIILYTPGEVSGSNNGLPNSGGEILQFTFIPWMNAQFAIQYKIYNKFNGGSSDYDGFGRNASDNNTLYVSAWLVY